MENNINKDNSKKPSRKYTPKKKKVELTDKELNEKLTSLLKEEAEKITPCISNEVDVKTLTDDEGKELLKEKYLSNKANKMNDLLDNIELHIEQLISDKKTEKDSDKIKDEDVEEMSEEDIEDIIKKINIQISKINSEFYSLIKEEEEEEPTQEIKVKVSKPKTIKIPKETYKQIKAHCKEHNVDIEDWIEKITLNEINRIIIRLGDLDYKSLKKRKEKKEKV